MCQVKFPGALAGPGVDCGAAIPSRRAPSLSAYVAAKGPSGVLSRDACASCSLSGEDGRKHINNMISTSGLLTNVIATTVATSRHF